MVKENAGILSFSREPVKLARSTDEDYYGVHWALIYRVWSRTDLITKTFEDLGNLK